jgi:CheY-like chemotaxis protein
MIRILVVEDHPLVRDFFLDTLRDVGGYEVDLAEDRRAVQMAAEKDYDLFIVDVYLYTGDLDPVGLSIIREIQQNRPESRFIVMSGKSLAGIVEKAVFELGVTDFLAKPVTVRDLLRKVSKVLGS